MSLPPIPERNWGISRAATPRKRGVLLVVLLVAVVASCLTLFTRRDSYMPNYSGGADFDGYQYGFPLKCLCVPERSGSLSIDPLPLIGDLVIWVIIAGAVEIARRRLPFWQFSLRRLLLAVALWALACGCFRAASVDDIRAAVIPGVLSLGLGIGLLTHHVLIACALVVALSFLSWWTTTAQWDGGFRSCEIRLQVRDESDSPVPGVHLDVQPGRTTGITDQAPNPYFVLEYEELPLTTDAEGRVVFHQMGYRFSGVSWELFWCIPIGWNYPGFDYCLSKEGYTSVRLPFSSLYEPDHRLPATTTLLVDGQPVEFSVYAHTATMRQE